MQPLSQILRKIVVHKIPGMGHVTDFFCVFVLKIEQCLKTRPYKVPAMLHKEV
jgi:hypothetical protein